MPDYYVPKGGLPEQTDIMTSRAMFTESYAVIPKSVMADIVTSFLPHWQNTRCWILARPLSGFAETFSYYIVELSAQGGSTQPEPNKQAQGVIFVVDGSITLTINGTEHQLNSGGYAYLPPASNWQINNATNNNATFHWIRKQYQAVAGIDTPDAFVTNEKDVAPSPMSNTDLWTTTRFTQPDDLRHDMHVNIVNFKPGGVIPFPETHVMEHGLYVLEGKAVYRLNQDWVEVEAGDFMWLRAFCPQACYAGGPGNFRYLLYKDVNRHAALTL